MEKNPTCDRLVQIIDEDKNDLVDLCLQLGNTTSPHGKERVLGEAVLGWLKECGIHGELQFITDESVNAVATVTGTSSGQSLIFNAHMDTGPELAPDATEIERKLDTAWIDKDMLFGKGMINEDIAREDNDETAYRFSIYDALFDRYGAAAWLGKTHRRSFFGERSLLARLCNRGEGIF